LYGDKTVIEAQVVEAEDKLAAFREQAKAELAATKAKQSARGRKQAAIGLAALERHKANQEANERLVAWFKEQTITVPFLETMFNRIRKPYTPAELNRMAHKAMHFLAKKPKLETIHDVLLLGELLPGEGGHRLTADYQLVYAAPMPLSQFLKLYPHPERIEPEAARKVSRHSLEYKQRRMRVGNKKKKSVTN
jgi:hypothetical protein